MFQSSSPLRKDDIKENNEKLVLSLIHNLKITSQSEIVISTGLKPPTVMRIFNNLEEMGLIQVVRNYAPAKEARGRKPVWYSIRPDAFYLFGVDFYSSAIALVVENFSGEVLSFYLKELPKKMDSHQIISTIKKTLSEAIEYSHIPKEQILGIGIGAPGIIDTKTGIIVESSQLPDMPNYYLKDDFEETFGVPVIVHANASIIALSEYYYGKREKVESMITYLIRGGVGGSYINRGQVFESRGRSTFGLGHMMISNNQDDPLFPRMQYLQDMINENILIDLASKVDSGINDIQALDYALSLRRQDVIDALKGPVNALALSVISLSNIINPETFIFVTRSNHLSAFLAEEVSNIHKGNRFVSKGIETEFYGAPYLPQQFCKGSILLVLKAFFAGALGPLNKYSAEHEVALVDEH